MTCISHDCIAQNSFTALETLYDSPIHPSLSLSHTPGNQRSFSCLHCFASSRMPHSWNHAALPLFWYLWPGTSDVPPTCAKYTNGRMKGLSDAHVPWGFESRKRKPFPHLGREAFTSFPFLPSPPPAWLGLTILFKLYRNFLQWKLI